MVDENALGQIFNPATGVWALVAMAAVTLFKAWPYILERLNERHRDTVAERAGDWSRLRDERDHALELLTKCQEQRVEWMHRAITAEAILQGYGEADQRLAIRLAAERLAMSAEKKPEGGDK